MVFNDYCRKAIVLASGSGTRLKPMTDVINKHLIGIYDKLMIEYPIQTLVNAGFKDVAIVVGGSNPEKFIPYLQNGKQFGLDKLTYIYQEQPLGIAHAIGLCRDFADGEPVCVILGDNIFSEDVSDLLKEAVEDQFIDGGSVIFLKPVKDPERFGVVKFDPSDSETIMDIIEKPANPPSACAVTGLYLFDENVFDIIDTLEYSDRNELEVTDINKAYLKSGELSYKFVKGAWFDAGKPESLHKAACYWAGKNDK